MGSYLSLEDGEKPTDEILQDDSAETNAPSDEPLVAKKKSKVKSSGAKTKGAKKKLVKTKKRAPKSDA